MNLKNYKRKYKIYKHMIQKRLCDTEKIVLWKSKGLSAKKLTTPTKTDNNLFPSIKWYGNSNFYLVFKGSFLKQKKCNLYSS